MKGAWVLFFGLLGCSSGMPQPVTIDTANDSCTYCRMIVSDVRLGAQIVTPGEDSRVFDDLGCLRDYLEAHPLASEAVVYVADHLTAAWVPAHAALYTKSTSRATPMASGLLAHADARSRDADVAAVGGQPVDVATLLGKPSSREARE